ncbi:HAD family hydrolase [Rubrivivax gelatinosus]|uniref:Putative HAD superfamily hydrolase n=1 Tax=Rubrivivax gelatinosus TaxID=28068 RepID=A0A4R2M5S4_RUBGE|nr:HAD family hydrolase [Rubrivivax gelatinosus]MBK1690095.1 hypothetical protein [Rubrivivax gelatinosus]TCP01570.1 putative HAD superfamily hydrolase [Rubrivivax gelatinosus]
MNTMTPTERAVREVRQAAFELNATDQKQALRMLQEALKLQPGHADLLGDLAALHLQCGRHAQCIQAASAALAANPLHDDSAFALALSLDATGETARAHDLFLELTEGTRAERFASQPELVELCRAKLQQGLDPAAAPAAVAAPVAAPAPAAAAPSGIYAPMIVRPDSMGRLLEETEGIRALTLDCFDTILWRHTDHPSDVFYDLQHRPAFKAAGIDAVARQKADVCARQLQLVRTGRTEVTLEQIHQAARPGLSREMLHWLAEDELAAEMQACRAHPSAVRLLRDAQRRRLPVTIVSDTYFDSARLRRLLQHTLPADAYAAIGNVVVSSENGVSKQQGLFRIAGLHAHGNTPASLHLGDNKAADFEAPRSLGLSATHLLHEHDVALQRRRMAVTAVSLLDGSARHSRAVYMPYHPVHATHGSVAESPPAAIGHATLGPILHAFASWLEHEGAALADARDKVKLVFLMRDAHLPLQTYRAIKGQLPSSAAFISRFTAYAASLRSLEDIDQYLATRGPNLSLPMLARQLLLSPERTAEILEQAEYSRQPLSAFTRAVRQPVVVAEIVAASTQFRHRLRRHLEREADMKPGDTIVFVDIGASGTIQRLLTPIMAEEWNVEVYGRYLLAIGSVDDRFKGLMDGSWLDSRALNLLLTGTVLLETLLSCEGASTVGYAEDGTPVLEDDGVEIAQRATVDRIQAECLRFATDAEAFFRRSGGVPAATVLRDEAMGSLARLTFFPNATELELLAQFQIDINLGTRVTRRLFDLEGGLEGLRRHGLLYVGSQHGAGRMILPAELRAAGLELSLAMITGVRFGVPITHNGWSMRKEPLLAALVKGERMKYVEIEANLTHDGFFAGMIPLPDPQWSVALAFGRSCEWLQLHSAEIVPLAGDREIDVKPLLVLEGASEHAPGVIELGNAESLVILPSGASPVAGKAALRVVFRPLTRRDAGEAPADA